MHFSRPILPKRKLLTGVYASTGIVFIVVLWVSANTSFNKDYKTGVMEADARGYYAYLPAVFIYHDLNFGFFDSIERGTYYSANLYYDYRRDANGKVIDKYYAGTALCLTPFFLAGHALTLAKGMPADGYSYYYTLLAHWGALFYFFLALVGLVWLFRSFGIKDSIITWVLPAIVFGTNLFYYVVTEFGMSHLYSFTTITWFCVVVKEYFNSRQARHLLYSALLLGLISLIRPVNILVLLALPFLAGSPKNFASGLQSLLRNLSSAMLSLIVFSFLVSIQLIIYKISTGSWVVYSYRQEGFNFFSPQISNFLFSYRKGMFVYTPLLLVSLSGLIILYRINRFRFYALLGFLAVLIYILSSWHMWFYGGSFSQRVMIEFYPFFALLPALTWQQVKSLQVRRLFIGIVILLVVLCQVQTYQYRRMQIHWSDMNKERYWQVFMRIDKLM